MNSSNYNIGSIVSVSGSTVSVHMNKNIHSNIISIEGETYKIGQIGTLLAISLGLSTTIALITRTGISAVSMEEVENTEMEKLIDDHRWVEAVLVGEIQNGNFERGVSQYPNVGDGVYLVSNDLLKCIYKQSKDIYPIDIGTINESSGLRANLDLNKLISRHCAILGSTGSGKSNAVSILLHQISSKLELKGSRILIIDPHGEYSETFKNSANIFKIDPQAGENNEKPLFIPFWALETLSLLEVIGIQLEPRAYDGLSAKVNEKKEISLDKMGINKLTANYNAPIPYNLYKMWFEIDEEENFTCTDRTKPKETKAYSERGDWETLKKSKFKPAGAGAAPPFLGNSNGGLRRFADSLWLKMVDPKYNFIFHPGEYKPLGTEGVPQKELYNLINEWFSGNHKITILDLSEAPIDIIPIVTGSILSFVYESLRIKDQKASGKNAPMLFVLEEAHIYLSNDTNGIAKTIIRRISKEGRKYGAGLFLISQRAGEIDETVLSQSGTIIALRMNNLRDRSAISAAIQDDLKSITDLLPILRTGECIVSGESTIIPLRVKFDLARFAKSGSDPKVSEQWLKDKPQEADYKQLIKMWRRESEEK